MILAVWQFSQRALLKALFSLTPDKLFHTPQQSGFIRNICQKKFPQGLYIISVIGTLFRDSCPCHRRGLEALQCRINTYYVTLSFGIKKCSLERNYAKCNAVGDINQRTRAHVGVGMVYKELGLKSRVHGTF